MENPIFGLRFKSNEALQPTIEELRLFLETRKDGIKEKHQDDLSYYVRDLTHVEDFKHNRTGAGAQLDLHEKMLLGVLAHSQFFTPSLKSAVEQFKFHYHRLCGLDFKKPQAFIRSANEEIQKSGSGSKADQLKIAKLQSMIEQRNADLEALSKLRGGLATELHNIAVYINDNLEKIQHLCESSITVLVGLQLGGEKTGQLIEDIKTHFKEQVRDYLQLGPVTKQYVESLKQEVATLSRQLSQLVLEDIYAVTTQYEALYDHTKNIRSRLEAGIRGLENKQHRSIDEDRAALGRIEQILVALISDYRLGPVKPKDCGSDDKHNKLLLEKRKEMLDHVFELLKKEKAGQR